MSKERSDKKLSFEEATKDMEIGEFRLKAGCGKHYIHQNPLCKIKGKPGQRVVLPGDILICPPYIVDSFRNKFDRIDAPDVSKEEVEMREKPSDPPTIQHKGKGKYNVINASGLKLNDAYLTKAEATELIQSYG